MNIMFLNIQLKIIYLIYINKDHVIKAVKLEGYGEDYYLISLTNGAKLIVDNTDFNTLK